MPGAIQQGKLAIWQLGQVELRDADNARFAVQGFFVP